MAKCEKVSPVEPICYVLSLTEREAQALRSLLGKAALNGPTSSVFNALVAAGVMVVIRGRNAERRSEQPAQALTPPTR